MQLHRLYYLLKPFMPRRLRMSMRRTIARRKLAASKGRWPINENIGSAPAGWQGWPGGKKFAVVLTHDVEGPDGVAKSQGLAELEQSLGFKSSFNFIPEGTYRVSPELRHWLRDHGFEVGVHDLNHDGHLYSSQEGFAKKAARINHYLREWGATGFRAGFMLRNLDWVHHLNIEYDASTFDTDPFEPQPDGAGTIFPFWIDAPTAQNGTIHGTTTFPCGTESAAVNRGGYVELPYTLPQDSTLFLILEEQTNEIWRKKVDWIAARGGMVLINVHPDYLDMTGSTPAHRSVVRDHYRNLLEYLNHTYAQQFWHALPREMAAYVHGQKNQQPVRSSAP